jgi:hypothetical protein
MSLAPICPLSDPRSCRWSGRDGSRRCTSNPSRPASPGSCSSPAGSWVNGPRDQENEVRGSLRPHRLKAARPARDSEARVRELCEGRPRLALCMETLLRTRGMLRARGRPNWRRTSPLRRQGRARERYLRSRLWCGHARGDARGAPPPTDPPDRQEHNCVRWRGRHFQIPSEPAPAALRARQDARAPVSAVALFLRTPPHRRVPVARHRGGPGKVDRAKGRPAAPVERCTTLCAAQTLPRPDGDSGQPCAA